MSVLFVSGIDTDIGKTYATGLLAKSLMQQGVNVITQKLVQTGISKQADGELGIADDILSHRQLMQMPLQPCDLDFTTCPYRYEKPASPHLSAALANQPLNINVITDATKALQVDYEMVLLEGAGGLLVPINEQLLTLDYIAEQGYPIVLVTSGRLGSINHTLLSLEAIKSRGLMIHSVIYNHIHDDAEQTDAEIANSTIDFLQAYLTRYYPKAHWLVLAKQANEHLDDADIALPTAFI